MTEYNQHKLLRILRILYPIWVLIGIFSLIYVPSTLIEHNDAIATAKNISDNTLLFRFGILGSLLTQFLFIVIPLLLYKFFEKVHRFQAKVMAVLALLSIPITMYNEANKLVAITLLDDPQLMMQSFELFHQGMIISSIFWGLWLFPLGGLVNKSGYFPKVFGFFLIAAGFGYLLGAFTNILAPNATSIKSIFELLTFGEVLFILWLTFRGAKLED